MKLTEDNIQVFNLHDTDFVQIRHKTGMGEYIKQQILENQDKADLYNALNDAKGKEFIKGVIKNQQIVERLKEIISKHVEEDGFIEPEKGLLKIESILKGDKESKADMRIIQGKIVDP